VAVGCDGQAIQNTVFGPNHAYIATDVAQAHWERGINRDERTPERDQPCWYPDNFNAYQCAAVDAPVPTVTCQLQPATGSAPLDPDLFNAACELDGAARRRGEPGIVCHANEPATLISKTFTLQDNVIGVRYDNVPAGHVVTNEFCVDLENSVLCGNQQRKSVTGGAVTLTNAGAAVTVTLISGCQFDVCATHVPAAGVSAPRDWGAAPGADRRPANRLPGRWFVRVTDRPAVAAAPLAAPHPARTPGSHPGPATVGPCPTQPTRRSSRPGPTHPPTSSPGRPRGSGGSPKERAAAVPR
jgi:hypothetical protein